MSDPASDTCFNTECLWQFDDADGHTFRCDVLADEHGWVAWYVVNDQRIGCEHFSERQEAVEWGGRLLHRLRRA